MSQIRSEIAVSWLLLSINYLVFAVDSVEILARSAVAALSYVDSTSFDRIAQLDRRTIDALPLHLPVWFLLENRLFYKVSLDDLFRLRFPRGWPKPRRNFRNWEIFFSIFHRGRLLSLFISKNNSFRKNVPGIEFWPWLVTHLSIPSRLRRLRTLLRIRFGWVH